MPDSHPLVCRFGAFGDMVMLTPLLQQLHQRCGLPCDLVAIGAWNHELFRNAPYVRDVLTIESRAAPYWFNRSQRTLVKTLQQRTHRFVWICETNPRSYRLLARAGINPGVACSQPELAPIDGEHYCDKWLRLGELSPPGFNFGVISTARIDTNLCVGADEIADCRYWLKKHDIRFNAPLVCIQVGSKRTTRRGRANRSSNTKFWPENHWAAVIDGILARLPQASIILCGVETEIGLCNNVKTLCQTQKRVHNLAGKLPMRRLLALLSIAHSCVSVDTGPAHAAAALNCPLVVLFGRADPNRFRPSSKQSPVRLVLGHGNETQSADIGRITPAQVLQEWSHLTKADPRTADEILGVSGQSKKSKVTAI